MEVLKTVQWSLGLMGYGPQQHRFSIKQVRRGLEALLILVLHFVYIFRVASTVQEKIFSTFMIITMSGIFISFVSTANKTAMIFILIRKAEKIYNEGKNAKVKKMIIQFKNSSSMIFSFLFHIFRY